VFDEDAAADFTPWSRGRGAPSLSCRAVNVLRASGLVKRFETVLAVDGVGLTLGAGEVHGLLGPNGAGKTTLLRMLLGLVRPDGGSCELLGRAVSAPSAAPPPGVAGFVEEPAFYPYLSGRANLELMIELDRRGDVRSVDEVLDQVDLARRAGARVSTYSTGMRQRLGLAAALLRSPRLLLLDEPTSGLDPVAARETIALLRELSRDGVAALISSHLIGELEGLCDSFTLLRRGRVIWQGTGSALRAAAPPSAYVLVTDDDARALEIADGVGGVQAGRMRDGSLAVAATQTRLDEYVVALIGSGVALRRLDLLASPLESMFFALTSEQETDQMPPIELAERAVAAS
jgi:ABC-2 type transport system ATP-binding protein